jgi:hypothetical protein
VRDPGGDALTEQEQPINRVRRLLNDRIRRHELKLLERLRRYNHLAEDGEKEERGFIDGLYSALGLVVSVHHEEETVEMFESNTRP